MTADDADEFDLDVRVPGGQADSGVVPHTQCDAAECAPVPGTDTCHTLCDCVTQETCGGETCDDTCAVTCGPTCESCVVTCEGTCGEETCPIGDCFELPKRTGDCV